MASERADVKIAERQEKTSTRFLSKSSIPVFFFAIIVTGLSVVHYLATLLEWAGLGFPLDDSWIHLQYAKTVFRGHPWEYSIGIGSTGATSPLWAIILSFLFIFNEEPTILVCGVYGVSTCFYVVSSYLIGVLTWNYTGKSFWSYPAIVAFVLVPGNTWLMLSGMEFPLFLFLTLLAFYLLGCDGPEFDMALGVTGGLLFLARPEGVIVAATVFVFRFFDSLNHESRNLRRFSSLGAMVLLAILVASPWILHCLNATGYPLPDTVIAKVHIPTESELEVWHFYLTQFSATYPFILVGLLSVLYFLFRQQWQLVAIWIPVAALLSLYWVRTPMQALINNHRYLTPLFCLLQLLTIVLVGMLIEYHITTREPTSPKTTRYLGLLLIFMLVVPLTPVYVDQANLYGNSVKNINDLHVQTALWINENIPENQSIAIVDAGVLAFFCNRTTIDLVGLTTPDMIHLNMSPREKLLYIRDMGCSHLVTFKSWFWPWAAELHSGFSILYSVAIDDNVISGSDCIAVYFINWNLSSLRP